MTTLISSDWHLSDNPRDAYRFQTVRKLVPDFIRKHKVTRLLYLGDCTEAKDNHSAELVNAVVALFRDLAKLCPIVMLQGNHDWKSSPDNPFFGFLKHIDNITWVNRPTQIGDDIFLPHTNNHEKDWADIDFHTYKLAFAHQTFQNSESNTGFKFGGVPLNIFPKGLTVISGDIHNPQTIGPVTYVGSPYSIDFGDEAEFRMLLLEGTKLTSLPCPGPQKRIVYLNALNLDKRGPFLEKGQQEPNAGDILKVLVNINASEISKWSEIVSEVRRCTHRYTVHIIQPIVAASSRKEAATGSRLTKSDEQLLEEYATSIAIEENTLRVGQKLL